MKKVEPGMNKANTSEIRMSPSREHQKLSHANSLEFRLVVQDWRRKGKKKKENPLSEKLLPFSPPNPQLSSAQKQISTEIRLWNP